MKAAKTSKTVSVGALRLEIKQYADGRYGFDFISAEERKKVRCTEQKDAEQKALEILGAARGGMVDRLAIDGKEFAEFLQWRAQRKPPAPIPQLCEDFIADKERSGCEPPTIREIKSTLTPFAEAFPGEITMLTRAEVLKFLDTRGVSPRRWNNMRAAIISLFKFARRNGNLTADLTPVETIGKRKVSVHVQTYTPEELKELLRAVPKEWLPLIVLGAFCGLRPEEIHPDTRNGGWKNGITWENVNWARGVVDVPATVAKDRRRRFAPLTEAAQDFLKPWRKSKGRVTPARDVYKPRLAWMEGCGVKWKNDGLRHSFASYRLAIRQNMAELTLEMGNSAAMVHRHYLDLKHRPEAIAYFAIRAKDCAKCVTAHPRKSPVHTHATRPKYTLNAHKP